MLDHSLQLSMSILSFIGLSALLTLFFVFFVAPIVTLFSEGLDENNDQHNKKD
jgi:hypothetical protein